MEFVDIQKLTLSELASLVCKMNDEVGYFDDGEFPAVDELDDAEEKVAREEYEGLYDELIPAYGMKK